MNLQGVKDALKADAQPEPAAEVPQTGEAMWRSKAGDDIPIEVIGTYGRDDKGREYLKVEGSNTGIPGDEVEFNQPATTPEVTESSAPEATASESEVAYDKDGFRTTEDNIKVFKSAVTGEEMHVVDPKDAEDVKDQLGHYEETLKAYKEKHANHDEYKALLDDAARQGLIDARTGGKQNRLGITDEVRAWRQEAVEAYDATRPPRAKRQHGAPEAAATSSVAGDTEKAPVVKLSKDDKLRAAEAKLIDVDDAAEDDLSNDRRRFLGGEEPDVVDQELARQKRPQAADAPKKSEHGLPDSHYSAPTEAETINIGSAESKAAPDPASTEAAKPGAGEAAVQEAKDYIERITQNRDLGTSAEAVAKAQTEALSMDREAAAQYRVRETYEKQIVAETDMPTKKALNREVAATDEEGKPLFEDDKPVMISAIEKAVTEEARHQRTLTKAEAERQQKLIDDANKFSHEVLDKAAKQQQSVDPLTADTAKGDLEAEALLRRHALGVSDKPFSQKNMGGVRADRLLAGGIAAAIVALRHPFSRQKRTARMAPIMNYLMPDGPRVVESHFRAGGYANMELFERRDARTGKLISQSTITTEKPLRPVAGFLSLFDLSRDTYKSAPETKSIFADIRAADRKRSA